MIPPIRPIATQFKSRGQSILKIIYKGLVEMPYQPGDRVAYHGFMGRDEPGTVVSCNMVDAGYSKFIRLIIKPDNHRDNVTMNLSLFPDRVKRLEEK